jgi:hypothetical protein
MMFGEFAMIKGLILAVIGLGCPLVWAWLVVPLIARLFGLRLKMAFVAEPSSNNHLSRWQYVFIWGVLSWGLAQFFLLVFLDSADSLLTTHPFAQASPGRILYAFSICLISGALLGLWSAPKQNRPPETRHF